MKAPAFQFYPADHLSDMKVRMLSWPSRGLYIDLLCYCWREGWIPSDSSAIAQLCGCHDLAIIEPCFALFAPHPDDSGKLIHPRLDHEREKQKAFREERKAAGTMGAMKRWKRDSSAIKQPIAENSSSSSIFSLQSTDIPPLSKENKPGTKARGTLDELKAYAVEIGAEAADGEACFHQWEGNGWTNDGKPVKAWKPTMKAWSIKGYLASQKRQATRRFRDCANATAGAPQGSVPAAPADGEAAEIVALYPRQERTVEAIAEVQRQIAAGEDPAAIMAGTRAAAAAIQTVPGGHANAYVPGALNFFKNQRWRDDPNTIVRSGTNTKTGAPPHKLDLGGRRPSSITVIPGHGAPYQVDSEGNRKPFNNLPA